MLLDQYGNMARGSTSLFKKILFLAATGAMSVNEYWHVNVFSPGLLTSVKTGRLCYWMLSPLLYYSYHHVIHSTHTCSQCPELLPH